ncbi:MAG: SDR family oxidoreductase [Anaerolineae bacterium]|nr:SDR family oxidoreductase [Anaerolineae bacterium]
MNCRGKVAIVTGAAGDGMGRSIALTLAREGAKVVVNYRTSEQSARAIVDHIERREGSAIAVKADVFEADGCKTLVDAAVERFGQVDICIIGPGGGWHPESPEGLASAGALEDLQQEVAPIFYLMPLVLPGMYARGWGRIIGLAMHPRMLSPAYAYNVGKAARVQALLLAQEQAWKNGVTVNVIAPGPVAAIESLEGAVEMCDHGIAWQQRTNITPQDVAEGIAFLCSEAGRFITGSVLPYVFHG